MQDRSFMTVKALVILLLLFLGLVPQQATAELADLFIASPVVHIHSKYRGFGVLSHVGKDIFILTNSHILRGATKATVEIPQVLTFQSSPTEVPPLIEFSAEVLTGSDDPVGDIVLLKVPNIANDRHYQKIQKTSQWLEFCEIKIWDCWSGYQTKPGWIGFNNESGILILQKLFQHAPQAFQKLSLLPSFQALPIEEKTTDSVIASENEKLLTLPTYGRPGFSGLPLVEKGDLKGLLTITHFDGTPLVYGTPLQDIAKRLQKVLFDNSQFNYHITGKWNLSTGDLLTKVSSFQIQEKNSNAIAGASGGGEGGTSGGGEGGTSGDRLSDPKLKSKLNDTFLQIEFNAGFFGLNSLAAVDQHSLAIKNPLIARNYQPLIITKTEDSEATTKNAGDSTPKQPLEIAVPFLISPSGVPQLATTARLSPLLLHRKVCSSNAFLLKITCEIDTNKKESENYFIPDIQSADLFLKQARLNWPKMPKYIRYYQKKNSQEISSLSSHIGNAPTLDNTMALEIENSNSLLQNEEAKLITGYKDSARFQTYQLFEKLRYTPDPWGYTPLFPFAVRKTSQSIIEFRFEDQATQTLIEIQIPKNGNEIIVSEFDLPAFRNHGAAIQSLRLSRISSDRNPSWWFQTKANEESSYRAFFSFNRDNLAELERIFIESPRFIFEIISCPISERECVR